MAISKSDSLKLLNVVGDLKRAVMFLVRNKNQNCIFIKNIINNYSNLIKIDHNITKFIDIKYLKDSSELPKIKAENLLTQSLRLQHYLGF